MRVTVKLFIASVAVVLGCVIAKVFLFGEIVKVGIRDQTALRKRNQVRGLYLKIPFPLEFKVYFFNVSNPMEIQNGAKPIVQEVGPYWYDEFIEKIDVVDNDMEDSLTYTPYHIFKFNQIKSDTLSDEDYVTIINPFMVGMINQVMQDSPVFLSIISQSFKELFYDPQSIFLTAKVKDILFDGVEINCKSKEFAANAVCSQLKTKMPGIKFKKGDEKIYLLSLLGSRNGTMTKRVKVLRGIKESKDLGKVLEIDGQKELTIWSTKQCNRFNGTDGWIFPPLLPPEEGLKSFVPDLCRNMKLEYVKDTVLKKLHVRIYEGHLGDQSNDESEKCYCRTPDTCLKKGVFDLSKCMGVPILTTLPHFLNTDESYLNKIEGLEPDVDKHGLTAAFEPMTGSPVEAYKRIQFNFDLQANKKVPLFANLTNVLFPLLWAEEGVSLEGDILMKLQGIFILILIANLLIYIFMAFGIISGGVAIYFHQKNKKEVEINPVTKIKKEEENNGHESNDMQNLTRRKNRTEKIGHVNPVMTGHEFDRY